MSDDLRDRIAAAISEKFRDLPRDMPYSACLVAADAVIRELELHRESAIDGVSPVDDPPPGHHRYVTEWKIDD